MPIHDVSGRLLVLLAFLFAMPTAAMATSSCSDGTCACVPRCRGTWHDEKTRKPDYDIRCDYACARGRDPWHAPDPDCRCHPPCGRVYVKKRLYKTEGREVVDRVPRYEVQMVPATPCDGAGCRTARQALWDPFGILRLLHPWADTR